MSFTPQIIELADGTKCVGVEDYKKLERERDEAREALCEWEDVAKHIEADHPDEVHCGCVKVLRKLLADALRERDEARVQYRTTELLGMALVKTIDELKAEKAAIFAQLVSLQAGSRRATLEEIAESVREKYDPEYEREGMDNE